MFSATGVLARGLASFQGTEAEKKLAELLYDDNIQVISSLELNTMASYTYHETSIAGGKDLCEKLIDMLEAVLSKPVDHTTLTVQKALVVLKHLLTYGAEKVINPCCTLGAYVDALQNYNTAVLAQQGSMGMFMRFKGGAVDKGGPVREVAQQLVLLMTNRQQLQFERSTKADPNSLVPVGSRDRAAFVTDEARLHALRKRMEQERAMMIKSNLAKSNSAFGGGYTSKDGKAIVGAAHGLDEMIKQAQKEKQKFSDEGGYQAPGTEDAILAAAQAEANLQDLLAMDGQPGPPPATSQSVDLLDFGAPAAAASSATNTSHQADLLGGWGAPSSAAAPAPAAHDIFGGMMVPPAPSSAPASNDPFGFAAVPVAPPASAAGADLGAASLLVGTGSASSSSYGISASAAQLPSKQAMAPQVDRFAALDALADSSSTQQQPTMGGTGAIGSTGLPPPDVSTLTDLSSLPISAAPVPVMPSVNTSSLKISHMGSTPVGIGADDNGDEDNAFVMGGAVGAGLTPLGPAPAAPPPPPPPGGW